jgi:UDP-glucose 4-epimerase
MEATIEKAGAVRMPRVETRTILVTGRDSLTRRVLQSLSADRGIRLVTLGPEKRPGRSKAKHLTIALDDDKLVDLFRREKPDAILHLDIVPVERPCEQTFHHNVLGSMNLMAAAAETGVRRFILRSSTWVHGARYNNPCYIPESRRLSVGGPSPYVRHLAEIERYAQTFLKHFSSTGLTTLRFAPLVATDGDSPFMRYLRMKPVPHLWGFDPLLQILHEEDAAAAIRRALESDVTGPVNIAPDGVLPLLKILRKLGRERVSIPHFLFGLSKKIVAGLEKLPFDPTFLRFNTCGDNQRMKSELGWTPPLTAAQTLETLLHVPKQRTRKRNR